MSRSLVGQVDSSPPWLAFSLKVGFAESGDRPKLLV